jgi:hypothetical protein
MEIYKKPGSKERLLEMMRGVTKEDKITINEDLEFEPLVKVPKKEDSQPFGGSKEKYQDGMGYGDEKPVNPNLRVKAPELEKFVKERSEPEKEEGLSGEKLLKSKFANLQADLEFAKLAKSYENLLKMKHDEMRAKSAAQTALSAVRDLIADYLREIKGIDVSGEDVQNFFTNMMRKFTSVVAEDDRKKMKDDPCWKGYEMVGKKTKDGKEVPNCVPVKEGEEEKELEDATDSLDPTDDNNNGDFVEGGLADDADIEQFDPKQISMGIEVEMEHTKDPKVALEIAMDHLMELPDYYTRLEKMEKGGKEELGKSGESPEEFAADREEMEGEFADYFDDLKMADEELKDNLIGVDMKTPNASEEMDFDLNVAGEVGEKDFETKESYKRFQQLDSKENLTPEEQEEYDKLKKEFD